MRLMQTEQQPSLGTYMELRYRLLEETGEPFVAPDGKHLFIHITQEARDDHMSNGLSSVLEQRIGAIALARLKLARLNRDSLYTRYDQVGFPYQAILIFTDDL